MLGTLPPQSNHARGLARFIPALASLRGYDFPTFRADLLAGLTVAAIAVPQAMAYALIAGLPVEVGLFTAVVSTLAGALFTSSRQLINGPTNAISIATLSVLAPMTTPETLVASATLLAFVVGIFQLSIAALRLGDLTRYISHSVILGFTAGACALLTLDQLKNLFGTPGRGGSEDGFISHFVQTWSQADGIHIPSAVVGISAILGVLLLRWLKGVLAITFSAELLLVVAASAWACATFDLEARGVRIVGDIPAHLPSFRIPQFDLHLLRRISGGALAVAVLGLLEAISMAKALSAHTRQRLDIQQQLLSEGMANLTGSFFQCMPGSGSLTRSAINHQAGAVTQWSGVISAIAVAATMLLFAPYARDIPRPALAGILILSAFKMVDWKALFYHHRASGFDATIVWATGLSAVLISVEFCILIGVLLSFVMAVPRIAHVHLTEFVATRDGYVTERLPEDHPSPQIAIFGLEGELFFAAGASLDHSLRKIAASITPITQVVILRLKRTRNPDAVGLSHLDEFVTEMRQRDVVVLFCGVRGSLDRAFHRSGLRRRLGEHHVFLEQPVRQTSTHQALEYAQQKVAKHSPSS